MDVASGVVGFGVGVIVVVGVCNRSQIIIIIINFIVTSDKTQMKLQ